MTRWMGLVLAGIASASTVARAGTFAAEAQAWGLTDVTLAHQTLTPETCAKFPLACAEAINLAASLLNPPRHLEFQNASWAINELPSIPYQTRLEQYQTKLEYERNLSAALAQNPLPFSNLMREVLNAAYNNLPEAMIWGYALNGFLLAFDPHASTFPVSALGAASAHTTRFGFGFSADHFGVGVVVHAVFRGSPADRAGVRLGDLIVATQLNLGEWKSGFDERQLRSTTPETLKLRVERVGQTLELSMISADFPVESVEGDWLASDVARLTIRDFPKLEVCGLVQSKLQSLGEMKVHRLILDLRGNHGGNVDVAACVAGLFVGSSRAFVRLEAISSLLPRPLDALAEKTAPTEPVLTTHDQVWTDALVVLIDAQTYSGGEALAQAIKTHRPDARLVGERTAGKGSMQQGNYVNPTLNLDYTTARLFLADNFDHERVGLMPHLQVPLYSSLTENDRFYPREGELHPNALPAEMPPPTQNDCIFLMGAIPGPDLQLRVATAVVRDLGAADVFCHPK